ncbi:MAG: hypothetical protein IJU76_03565 [Desulfovibrionaceae bacterium]|nr:hypothetical protein [Desulfovibrionaceae bacterium]
MITQLQNTAISQNYLAYTDLSSPQAPVTKANHQQNDVVTVSRPDLMTDEEAQEVMQDVTGTIGESPAEALTVHQGLDLSRVMALLEDI